MNQEPLNSFWNDLKLTCYKELSSEIPPYSKVAYFDYPIHSNIGDLLIWKGTETWIKEMNFNVVCRSNINNKRLPGLDTNTIILLHGGGNFGDIYKHQKYRERIINNYPNNKIIGLPQTIHYLDNSNISTSSKIINNHPNISLFLRDHKSLEFAINHFPNASNHLCPDMATFLFPMKTHSGHVKKHNLFLLRRDVEASDYMIDTSNHDWIGDWSDIVSRYQHLIRAYQAYSKLSGHLILCDKSFSIWKSLANNIIDKSILTISSAKLVTTSRLHGCILALLLGIPVNLLDNNYGKNLNYFNTWLSNCTLCSFEKKDDYSL